MHLVFFVLEMKCKRTFDLFIIIFSEALGLAFLHDMECILFNKKQRTIINGDYYESRVYLLVVDWSSATACNTIFPSYYLV